jgi:hypothetical protein
VLKYQRVDGSTLIRDHLESESHKLCFNETLFKQKCDVNTERQCETQNQHIFVDEYLKGEDNKRKINYNEESNKSKLARLENVEPYEPKINNAVYGMTLVHDELKRLFNRNTELEDILINKNYENEGMKAQLDVIVQEKLELEESLNILAREKMILNGEIRCMKERSDKLSKEIVETRENADLKKQELDTRIKDLLDSNKALKDKNQTQAYQITGLNKEITQLKDKLTQSENLLKENQECKDKIRTLKNENESLFAENLETTNLFTEIQIDKKELEKDVINLKKRNEEILKELVEIKGKQHNFENSNAGINLKIIEFCNELVDFTIFMRQKFNIIPNSLTKFYFDCNLNDIHTTLRLELNLLKRFLVDKLDIKRRELAHTQTICNQYKESINDLNRNLAIITYDRDYVSEQLNDLRLKLKDKIGKNTPVLFDKTLEEFSNDIDKQTSHLIAQVLNNS